MHTTTFRSSPFRFHVFENARVLIVALVPEKLSPISSYSGAAFTAIATLPWTNSYCTDNSCLSLEPAFVSLLVNWATLLHIINQSPSCGQGGALPHNYSCSENPKITSDVLIITMEFSLCTYGHKGIRHISHL